MSLSYSDWDNIRTWHDFYKIRNGMRKLIKMNSTYSEVAELCGCSESHLSNALSSCGGRCSKRLRARIFQALLICLHREANDKLLDYMNRYGDKDIWSALSPAMEKVIEILTEKYDFDSIDGDSNPSANDPVRVLRIGRR